MLKKVVNNKIIRNFLLALVSSVIIIVLVFWWLKSYTNHGEKIETPNFVGLTVSNAQKLAEKNNLSLVIDSVFMHKVEKGTVFLQNPIPYSDSAKSWVKSERKIYLTSVRTSVQMIALPEIDGSELVVIPRLEGRFNFKKNYIPGDKGKVLKCQYNGKDIKTGDMLPRNSLLVLIIGTAENMPVLLPNLYGLSLDEANNILIEKSLSILALYSGCVTKEDTLSALIVKQTPEFTTGSNILEGSEVIVVLNKKEDVNLNDTIQ
jgi:hypothetical protein